MHASNIIPISSGRTATPTEQPGAYGSKQVVMLGPSQTKTVPGYCRITLHSGSFKVKDSLHGKNEILPEIDRVYQHIGIIIVAGKDGCEVTLNYARKVRLSIVHEARRA